MVGKGSPVAEHSNITVCPTDGNITDAGFNIKSGAAGWAVEKS